MPIEDSPVEGMEKSMDAEQVKVGAPKLNAAKDKPSGGNKPHRKRKRRYFNEIREQMEFYFGDANLSKDRFLKQLTEKDPYVPLDIFLTFNKMKALAKDTAEIAKSITNSQLLELDETQQKVRRKTALPSERNVDEKTLYVESIPPTADHDWVKQNFERFGKVTYVSLPKYAKSRKIKEFGFIEFEKQESIFKAVKAFQEFKGVLSMQETDPAELKSIKAFLKEQKNAETSAAETSASDKEKQQSGKKKRKHNEAALDGASSAKKIKTDDSEYIAANSSTEDESEQESSTSGEETATVNETTDGEPVLTEAGKKKRRKKKKKSKKTKRNADQDNDANFFDLKVLPKRDWKRLRNKYLNLQREKVAELKRKAWRAAQHSRENLAENVEANAGVILTPAKKSKPSERKIQKMKMNFYGAGDADTSEQSSTNKLKETKTNPALERAPHFNYAPGLIVEVSFLEPCVTIKEFKADMRQYAAVKYVDIKEGGMQAHLRLESAVAAEDFIRQVSCAEYKCRQLSGESESEYWRKIEQDREAKLNKRVKVPLRRGREKVKKLLTKHLRFGDEDDAEQREV